MNEQELRNMKSGVYNANSALQHLKAKVADLEEKVEFLRKGNVRVELDLRAVIADLREKKIL